MTEKTLVTLHHMRQIGVCVPLTKVWFAERNLDFNDFVRNGIDLETLKQFDDIHVKEIIEIIENGSKG